MNEEFFAFSSNPTLSWWTFTSTLQNNKIFHFFVQRHIGPLRSTSINPHPNSWEHWYKNSHEKLGKANLFR